MKHPVKELHMSEAEQLARRTVRAVDLYPTRGKKEYITERVDPVLYGSGEPRGQFSLTPDQLDSYGQNGYLVVPGVFSRQEVDVLVDEYERLSAAPALRGRDELILEPDSDRPRSIFSPHRFSGLFDRLSRDRRILDKVSQVLDSDVYLHHARINIKRALNGKSFPWHSDFETWHAEDGLPRCRVVSAWIMLTENSEFNGPLYLIPGSHRCFVSCAGDTPEQHHKASLRKQEYGVPSTGALRMLAARGGLASARGKAGTLILHEGNTMHGSPDNISPAARTNLFFVYNSVLNVPADQPFAAPVFRPEFLGSRDFTPLQPVANVFGK
jgi:ectoine hydroxylase